MVLDAGIEENALGEDDWGWWMRVFQEWSILGERKKKQTQKTNTLF